MVAEWLAHVLAAHAEGSGRPDETFSCVMLIMKAADGIEVVGQAYTID